MQYFFGKVMHCRDLRQSLDVLQRNACEAGGNGGKAMETTRHFPCVRPDGGVIEATLKDQVSGALGADEHPLTCQRR